MGRDDLLIAKFLLNLLEEVLESQAELGTTW